MNTKLKTLITSSILTPKQQEETLKLAKNLNSDQSQKLIEIFKKNEDLFFNKINKKAKSDSTGKILSFIKNTFRKNKTKLQKVQSQKETSKNQQEAQKILDSLK